MQYQKHFGKLKSSGADIVTIFMQLPEKKDHALIVNLNSMGVNHRTDLLAVANSTSGQQHIILADALHKRVLPSGESVLAMLDRNKYLRVVPITEVIMYPAPNMPVPLYDIVASGQLNLSSHQERMRQNQQNQQNLQQQYVPPQVQVPQYQAPQVPQNLTEIVNDPMLLAGIETNVDIANRLLMEAAQLRNDAVLKEQNAYAIAPELAPLPPSAPPVVETQIEQSVPKTRGRKKAGSEG